MRKMMVNHRPPLAPPPAPLQDPEHLIVPEHEVVDDDSLYYNGDNQSRSSSLDGYLLEEEKKEVEGNRLFSRRKVASTDVASVGNASDTSVSIPDGRESGRNLHEAAKLALNAGNFHGALTLFESILSAQILRFGPCHSSVAAAMHNVGGR